MEITSRRFYHGVDGVNRKFYHGFEGEPEIHFIICKGQVGMIMRNILLRK